MDAENITEERVWFRNNVFFILSSGCIFSKEDQQMLEKILSYFKPSTSRYLENKIVLTNYKDDSMKAIEKKLLIENGNYHICFIIGVYNSADVKNAPEEEYKTKGLVDYYMSWKEVTEKITDILSKYGFHMKIQTIKPSTKDIELKNETGIEVEVLKRYQPKSKHIKERLGYLDAVRRDKYSGKNLPIQETDFKPITRETQAEEPPNKYEFYDTPNSDIYSHIDSIV